MPLTEITQADIRSNKVLKLCFSRVMYKDKLESFLTAVNEGAKTDPATILRELLVLYEYYCEVSLGYRTVYFDFAWAVLENNPQFWTQNEKENKLSDLPVHIDHFYPENSGKHKEYDVATLNYGEYFVIGMNIISGKRIGEKVRPMFCYAMYLFFKQWSFQYNKEVLDEVREALDEEKEFRKHQQQRR